LGLTALLTGVWGWPGARQLGIWPAAAVLIVIGAAAGFAIWRLKRFAPTELSFPSITQASRLENLLSFMARIFWALYRLLGSVFGLAANLLEGDGGLLWTLLLLVLFITIFRGH